MGHEIPAGRTVAAGARRTGKRWSCKFIYPYRVLYATNQIAIINCDPIRRVFCIYIQVVIIDRDQN
jgi:hypothetical protein